MKTLPPRITYHRDEFAAILAAYANGQVVNWEHEGYRLAGGPDTDRIVVQYPASGHCCGLFHRDGVTSSYDPADFIIAPVEATATRPPADEKAELLSTIEALFNELNSAVYAMTSLHAIQRVETVLDRARETVARAEKNHATA